VDKVADMIAKARQSANSSLSAKAATGVRPPGGGGESGVKPLGGIAMVQKRPQAGGYAQLDGAGTASDEEDFLPRDAAGAGGSKKGGIMPSLVDRLEQSGIVHGKQPVGGIAAGGKSQQRTLPKLSGGGLFPEGSSSGRQSEGDVASPFHSASNTPARGRKDRYSDSEEDS
jgi:hypothetical protein